MCEPSGRTAGSAATVFASGAVPVAVTLPVQYAVAMNDGARTGSFGGVLFGPRRPAHPSATSEKTNKQPAVKLRGVIDGTESTLAFSLCGIKLSGDAGCHETAADLERCFMDETCSRPRT